MADNGELPPIGSEFIDMGLNDIGDNTTVLAIAHDLKLERVVYRRGSNLDDSEYFGAVAHECKPIDTRTDKEKAIDDMKYAYEKGNNMEDVLSEITKGYVAGVKWVGE
ncbi:MAG TPA: hypothetical protein EYN54_00950 [Methylococcaceae bacterium]|nr:hypothetical protein [Methylococcaceae bacterium]